MTWITTNTHMTSAYELVSVESRSLPFQGSLMRAKPAILTNNGVSSAGTRETALSEARFKPRQVLFL